MYTLNYPWSPKMNGFWSNLSHWLSKMIQNCAFYYLDNQSPKLLATWYIHVLGGALETIRFHALLAEFRPSGGHKMWNIFSFHFGNNNHSTHSRLWVWTYCTVLSKTWFWQSCHEFWNIWWTINDPICVFCHISSFFLSAFSTLWVCPIQGRVFCTALSYFTYNDRN